MKNRTVKSASKPLNERGFLKQSFSQYQFGSPIALVFEQTDCVDCDQLHQCVLAKESFDRYVDPFYAVQLDVWNRSPITLPNGRRVSAYDLARELNVTYTPTIILLDETFTEVIRAEAQFRSFHIESLFEYVSTGVYREEPQFQRFIDARADQQRARGDTVSILGTDLGCSTL
jgi:thioredoxin-related protein